MTLKVTIIDSPFVLLVDVSNATPHPTFADCNHVDPGSTRFTIHVAPEGAAMATRISDPTVAV